MSPEQRKKQIMQIIILLVLLGVMGVLFMIVAWPAIKGSRPSRPASATAPPAAGAQAQAGGVQSGSATDMPEVVGTKGAGVSAAAGQENISGVPTGLNPNLFQVFNLQAPRNPFIQREEWYADKLAEALPGYPELRDSNYFDTMEPYLPDIADLFGERDWSEIKIQRNQSNAYSISGSNPDGTIDTNIELKEDIPTSKTLTWTPGSGIPFASLSDPDYVAGLNLPEAGPPSGAGNLTGGVALPDSSDLFKDTSLPNMDEFLAEGGGSQDQLGPNGSLLGVGDQLTCRGVNLSAAKSTALIDFNGMPFLVQKGDVLPTHYEVLEVKQDGVMIKELRDGSTQWLPLTLLLEPAAAGN